MAQPTPERNTNQYNPPGTYKDPESGVELSVTMDAGADALVRMGWKLIPETETESNQPKKVEDLVPSTSKK